MANEKPAPPQATTIFHASDVSLEKDVAIGLVGEHARDIDPEVEARVLRKIDWFLIPAMIVGMSPVQKLQNLKSPNLIAPGGH